jgi:nicotinamide-nucleotide amidase
MKAEIISIGTELTTGQNLDTNCQWLSRKLAAIGIPVAFHTTVADDRADNLAVFVLASQRAEVVLSSGGLGPTQDDLTREVLAEAAGVPLVEDPASVEHIQTMFTKRGRVMPARNRVQALFPATAEPIFNEKGTAPGVWLKLNRAVIAAMPGVPTEMFHMYETQVQPRLLALGMGGGVFLQRKINTFGTGESAVEEKLLDLTKRGQVPEVGITVSDAIVSLRIFATAPTTAEALAQIAPVEATIRERLGELVFGSEDEDLHHAVVRLLHEQRQSLATAEGVTAGLAAQRLGLVPGASAWFRGGVVAYDPRILTDVLGVPAALIAAQGVVSAVVAQAVAAATRQKLGTDLALSTVGLAGPEDGASADKPAGLVFAALAHAQGTNVQSFNWAGTRAEVQSRAAKLALNLARLHLLKT